MNNKQQHTLSTIFKRSTCKNLVFKDIENLLVAAGCVVIEGNGSRVGFKKDELRLDLHRPHPGKEAKPYQVEAVREFLKEVGIKP